MEEIRYDTGGVKNWILSNWNQYGIKSIKSKDDMVRLLNILEANNQCFDDFHDASFNGFDEFCGIFGSFEDDDATYNTLDQFHLFFTDMESLNKWANEMCEEEEESILSFLSSQDIRKTSDGYVVKLYY